MWSSSKIFLGPLLFLLYINDKPQTVKCELLLYADDTCLIIKHNDINEIEIQLNKNLIYDWDSLICDWSVDNKLSIHFSEDKTKLILFSSKGQVKKASPLNIQYSQTILKRNIFRLHSQRDSLRKIYGYSCYK